MPRALKRFGQNFLVNQYYQQKIVDALDISENDLVLEIGPGRGALCPHIIERKPRQYVAVEVDDRLIADLSTKFGLSMHVINRDFLNLDLADMFGSRYENNKIIGNIPYNITSPILFKIIDHSRIMDRCVFMVQDEVARRICADPGGRDYGILSVVTQTYGQAEYLFRVTPGNFRPRPKVDSAVIRITWFRDIGGLNDHDLYRKIIRLSFNYRRKMLRNSLGRQFDKSIVYSIKSVDISLRPEQLGVREFKQLANEIGELTG